MTDKRQKEVYLGDGVYASFDGWLIWLAVNNPENIVVALEPDVLENLISYIEKLKTGSV